MGYIVEIFASSSIQITKQKVSAKGLGVVIAAILIVVMLR